MGSTTVTQQPFSPSLNNMGIMCFAPKRSLISPLLQVLAMGWFAPSWQWDQSEGTAVPLPTINAAPSLVLFKARGEELGEEGRWEKATEEE